MDITYGIAAGPEADQLATLITQTTGETPHRLDAGLLGLTAQQTHTLTRRGESDNPQQPYIFNGTLWAGYDEFGDTGGHSLINVIRMHHPSPSDLVHAHRKYGHYTTSDLTSVTNLDAGTEIYVDGQWLTVDQDTEVTEGYSQGGTIIAWPAGDTIKGTFYSHGANLPPIVTVTGKREDGQAATYHYHPADMVLPRRYDISPRPPLSDLLALWAATDTAVVRRTAADRRALIAEQVYVACGTDAMAGFHLKLSAQRVHQLRTAASEVHADAGRHTAAIELGGPVPSGRK